MYYAEMKIIIECDKLKKERLEETSEEKETRERERTRRKERMGCENILRLARPLTSAYGYQCGLEVWTHPASSAAITLLLRTKGNFMIPNDIPCR